MKIFTTGKKSYLLSHLNLKFTNLKKSKIVMHFGSPIDSSNLKRLKDSEHKCYELVDYCKKTNKHFVFASTMGIYDLSNEYEKSKLRQEQYIKENLSNFCILRIPRVYSSDRNKGLIKLLKENKVPLTDFNKVLEYITIQEFQKWFFEKYKSNGIFENNNLHKSTIKVIYETFCSNSNS